MIGGSGDAAGRLKTGASLVPDSGSNLCTADSVVLGAGGSGGRGGGGGALTDAGGAAGSFQPAWNGWCDLSLRATIDRTFG